MINVAKYQGHIGWGLPEMVFKNILNVNDIACQSCSGSSELQMCCIRLT